MKKLLLAGVALAALAAAPALAADQAPPAYKAPPVPAFSRTGCYVGVHGGGGWSQNDWDQFTGTVLGSDRASGFFGGGQVGCDYQAGQLVVGIEGQFSWGDLHGQALTPAGGVQTVTKVDQWATATGRVGYAFDRVLPYVKGGLAWAHSNQELDQSTNGAFVPVFAGSASVVGWTAGFGVEVNLLRGWSSKIEYNYLGFGTNGFPLTCLALCAGTPPVVPFNIKQNVQTVLFGLNYRFGPGALYARS